MGAEMAFGRVVGLWVHIDCVIGTCLYTGFAADATIRIKFDDAIIALIHGSHRTNTDTRWILAVVTASHLKIACAVGIFAGFYIFNPSAIDTQRHFVL